MYGHNGTCAMLVRLNYSHLILGMACACAGAPSGVMMSSCLRGMSLMRSTALKGELQVIILGPVLFLDCILLTN